MHKIQRPHVERLFEMDSRRCSHPFSNFYSVSTSVVWTQLKTTFHSLKIVPPRNIEALFRMGGGGWSVEMHPPEISLHYNFKSNLTLPVLNTNQCCITPPSQYRRESCRNSIPLMSDFWTKYKSFEMLLHYLLLERLYKYKFWKPPHW